MVIVEALTEEWPEEKDAENGKHQKEFDENDEPQAFANRHRAETITVKPVYIAKQPFHSRFNNVLTKWFKRASISPNLTGTQYLSGC